MLINKLKDWWRPARKSRSWAEPLEPPYIPREELSAVALEKGQLKPDEIDRVYYDSAHHWPVTVMMFFDPSWGEKHDVRPEVAQETLTAIMSRGNEALHSAYRIMFLAVKYIVLLMIFGGIVVVTLSAFEPRFQELLGYGVLGIVVGVLVCVIWGRYVIDLASRYRVILTAYRMIVVVDQLPWRDGSFAEIPWTMFNPPTIVDTLLGKSLGYVDIHIRSREQTEIIPALIRMPHGKELRDIFAWCRSGGEPRPMPRPQNVPLSMEPDEPTEEIPVIELATDPYDYEQEYPHLRIVPQQPPESGIYKNGVPTTIVP